MIVHRSCVPGQGFLSERGGSTGVPFGYIGASPSVANRHEQKRDICTTFEATVVSVLRLHEDAAAIVDNMSVVFHDRRQIAPCGSTGLTIESSLMYM